jgi:hypothetical protein
LQSTGNVFGAASFVGTTNQIGTLGAFTTGNGFALTDSQALTGNGAVNDTGAGSTLALKTTTGGITLTGNVSAINVLDLISAGAISQTGGSISAGTLIGSSVAATTLGNGANRVINLGAYSAGGSFTLNDGRSLNVTGPVTSTSNATIALSPGTLTVAAGGGISAPTSVQLSADSVQNQGTISGGAVNLTAGTSIASSGSLTATVLSGSAGTSADFTGSTTVGTLRNFSAGSELTLGNSADLIITGTNSAPRFVATSPGKITLAGGAIATGATAVPSGTLQEKQYPTSAGLGTFLSAANVTQTGVTTVNSPSGAAGTLRVDASGQVVFNDLQATSTNLYLVLPASGTATGAIAVKGLQVSYHNLGGSGSADLTGTVGGQSGQMAATVSSITPQGNARYRMNSCPIGSVNCFLFVQSMMPPITPLMDFPIAPPPDRRDDRDLILPNVADRDF